MNAVTLYGTFQSLQKNSYLDTYILGSKMNCTKRWHQINIESNNRLKYKSRFEMLTVKLIQKGFNLLRSLHFMLQSRPPSQWQDPLLSTCHSKPDFPRRRTTFTLPLVFRNSSTRPLCPPPASAPARTLCSSGADRLR